MPRLLPARSSRTAIASVSCIEVEERRHSINVQVGGCLTLSNGQLIVQAALTGHRFACAPGIVVAVLLAQKCLKRVREDRYRRFPAIIGAAQ